MQKLFGTSAYWVNKPTKHVEMYYPNGASAILGRNNIYGTYSKVIAQTGEADLSVFEIAVRESLAGRPVVIRSVDTDLILQTVAYGMFEDQPFTPKQSFMLRLSKGVTIDGIALCNRFGGNDPSARLSAAVLDDLCWWHRLLQARLRPRVLQKRAGCSGTDNH